MDYQRALLGISDFFHPLHPIDNSLIIPKQGSRKKTITENLLDSYIMP